MSIEDRLREILFKDGIHPLYPEDDDLPIKLIQLKQLFESERKTVAEIVIDNLEDIKKLHNFKTGQEWFTAFERELSELRGVVAEDEFEDILGAAKRASGLK